MTLNEYLSVMVCQSLNNDNIKYDTTRFLIPRVYCKDGFHISVQVNHSNYCGSENGIREFGVDWKMVEWGFPSEEIDGEKYIAESLPTMESVGGFVDISLVEELLNEHGGMDVERTFEEQYKLLSKRFGNGAA